MEELLNRRIVCPVRRWAQAEGWRTAVFSREGRGITYSEFDSRIEALRAALAQRGIRQGTTVAIAAPASVEVLGLLFAALRLGAVVAPISDRLPAAALSHRLRQTGAAAVISSEGAIDDLETILPAELSQFRSHAASSPQFLDVDQFATIVFTSGSTGEPRAAVHRLRNHLYSALGMNSTIGLAAGHRWLLALPLYHVGGLGIVFRCVLAGASVSLAGKGSSIAEEIVRTRATHVSLVSTQLRRLLDEGLPAAAEVRSILLGGSAIAGPLIEEAFHRRLPVHTSYGMTEMSSTVTMAPSGAELADLNTAGTVLPYRQVRIVNGCIEVRGQTLFAGYLEDGRVSCPVDADGWFETGDTGYLDEGGRLIVSGRIDDMFVSGGENVQPREIERALCQLPGIREAIVVPRLDGEYGQRPVAFVASTTEIDVDSLVRSLRDILPGFMIPDAIYSMPAPEPGSMKPSRGRLTKLAESYQACLRCRK